MLSFMVGCSGGPSSSSGSAGTSGGAGQTGTAGATGTAGSPGTAGATGTAGAAGTTGTAGTTGAADPSASARQACVDKINGFRATLSLAPLARWTAQETCADGQAKSDSESGKAHGAFGQCTELAQDECPGWGSIASITSGKSCLDQMWAEGPGTDYATHGHYINMSNPKYTKVACGYYTTPTGKVWAVQDLR
jgi:hypothetical protein